MEAVEVRTAVDGDLAALRDVFRRSSWSNEGDRPLLTAHPEFLEFSDVAVQEGRSRVALIEGRIIGFTSIIDCGEVIELEDLFVDPDWMGRGVGRSLVDDAVALARGAGAREIGVDGNEHALGFYERVGFVAGGRVVLDHGTAVRMTRSVVDS